MTIVGSGLSVAEGLPSMSDLAQQLIEEMPEIIEETDTNIKIRFNHEKTTIMQIMNEISKYCMVEDIHMRESELEDILKEIYKGAHKC